MGVDIGGTKTAVVFSKTPPEIAWRAEFATRPDLGPDHAIDRIIALINEGSQLIDAEVEAIGVSCGGPLDAETGVIRRPPNLPTWDDVPITDLLIGAFHVPCYLENDANAGAVAEHRYGTGRGCRNMIFLTMGTGLGAGLILNGSIFHGTNAMAGEIGHIRLTANGPEGYGKAGSVEGWASGAGMAQHGADLVKQAVAKGESTSLSGQLEVLTSRDIGIALQENDAVARRIVHQTGERLGDALAILVDLLNPEKIVVGGLALRLGESLLIPARKRMHEESLPAAASVCSVVPAELGESIGDVAALCVAMGLCVPTENARAIQLR